jgi:hypothetical protein
VTSSHTSTGASGFAIASTSPITGKVTPIGVRICEEISEIDVCCVKFSRKLIFLGISNFFFGQDKA